MKRVVLTFLIVIFLLVFQTTWFPFFPIHRFRPDLLLIFTLSLGFLFPPFWGGVLAFFIGYLMDLFSGNGLGFYTLSRPLVFFAAQFFKERFYLEGFYSQCLFVFIFAMLEGLLILILMSTFRSVPLKNIYPLWFTFLLPQSFFTGLVTPFLFSIFGQGFSLLFRSPKEGIKERR